MFSTNSRIPHPIARWIQKALHLTVTGTELLEVVFEAFVVGLIVGALVGGIKTFLHNAIS